MAVSPRDENRVPLLTGVSSVNGTTPTSVYVDPSTHEMLVKASVSITPSGTQDTNLIQVDGASFSLGQQLAAASLPVVLTAAQITTLTPLSTVTANLGTLNGAATSAKQDTGNTSLATIAGAITGTEMQVDVLTMPSVTVTATNLDIRDLTFASDKVDASGTTLGANSGVDIGDTTINNAGGGAAVNIQDGGNTITVDGTVTSTPSGIQDVNLTQIAGNNLLLSVPVTGAIFGIASIGDPASTEPIAIGGSDYSGAPGNTQIAKVDSSGNLFSVISDGGNTITVDGTVTVTQGTGTNLHTVIDSSIPGTGATNLGKAEDAAHASGDTGVFFLGVRNDNCATTFGANNDYYPLSTDVNGRLMVAQKASTGTLSNVSGSASSVTVLAANSARIGATITNDSSALLYLKFGATASTTSYTVVLAGAASAPFSYYEVPAGYTGIIDGIWASATGNARVTEIT